MEYEVKGALGSFTMNKANGGDRIPAELFKILKDDIIKVLHLICQQIYEISAVVTVLETVSFHPNTKEGQCRRMYRLPYNGVHMLARLCLKSFKLGFDSPRTKNFQMYKLGFKESEESEIKLPTFIGSWGKQENSRKTSTSASFNTLQPLCGPQQTVESS